MSDRSRDDERADQRATRSGAARGRRRTAGAPAEPRFDGDLVGVDVATPRPRAAARSFLLPLVIGLLAALMLASLRIDLLRGRYALAAAIEQEQALQSEKRVLTARMRELRDPAMLARRAEALGFVRPDELIDLPARGARAEGTVLADVGGVDRP